MLQAARVFASEVVKAAKRSQLPVKLYAASARATTTIATTAKKSPYKTYVASATPVAAIVACGNMHTTIIRYQEFNDHPGDGMIICAIGCAIKGAAFGLIWPMWIPYEAYRHFTTQKREFVNNEQTYSFYPGSFGWNFIFNVKQPSAATSAERLNYYMSRRLVVKKQD